MGKSILLSVKPQHAVHILNGNKTLELRKNTPKDFKGWAYIYITKNSRDISAFYDYYNVDGVANYVFIDYENKSEIYTDLIPLNGKVVARFWLDETTTYEFINSMNNQKINRYCICDSEYRGCIPINITGFFKKLCLSKSEIEEYGKGKDLYAWHIKKLEIIDKPMELSEFGSYSNYLNTIYNYFDEYDRVENDLHFVSLKRPPRSWQYVYVRSDE